jgi:hypothetical protein
MTSTTAILSALLALPVFKDDLADERKPAQYAAIASEIAQLKPPAGVGRKEWQALVLVIGYAESGYALRITEGNCRTYECDRGRARSNWQMHQNDHTRPVWDQLQGFSTLHVQVQTADKMLKRAYYTCERSNPNGFWAAQTILAYAGRGCVDRQTIAPWKGLNLRLEYWRRTWRVLG